MKTNLYGTELSHSIFKDILLTILTVPITKLGMENGVVLHDATMLVRETLEHNTSF